MKSRPESERCFFQHPMLKLRAGTIKTKGVPNGEINLIQQGASISASTIQTVTSVSSCSPEAKG